MQKKSNLFLYPGEYKVKIDWTDKKITAYLHPPKEFPAAADLATFLAKPQPAVMSPNLLTSFCRDKAPGRPCYSIDQNFLYLDYFVRQRFIPSPPVKISRVVKAQVTIFVFDYSEIVFNVYLLL